MEVDADGYLYFTTADAIVSLNPDGSDRWRAEPPKGMDETRENGAVGLHFNPDGHVVTVTDQGEILLLSRSNGTLLSRLSIPDEFGLELPPEVPPGVLADLLPSSVIDDFNGLQMGGPTELCPLSAGSHFSDNTIAIGDDGHMYVIGAMAATTHCFK